MGTTQNNGSDEEKSDAKKTSVHTGAGLPWYTLLAGGGFSACVAEVATIPIDTTKVRMQLDTQRGGTNNMFSAMRKIYGEEGLLAFWKGLNAGLQRQIVFASLRLSLYERIRSVFQGDAATTTLPAKIASGLAAGTIGISIANPTDVVKIRLQAEGKLAQGVEPRYKGAMHAYKKIVAEEGIPRLWAGLLPNIARNSVICAAELSAYDVAREFALQTLKLPDNTATHFLCGAAAGSAGTLAGNPIDVVKTRVMNARKASGGQAEYSGALDCLWKTLKNEGLFSFYRGALPQFVRITSWNIVMFICYEKYKQFFVNRL